MSQDLDSIAEAFQTSPTAQAIFSADNKISAWNDKFALLVGKVEPSAPTAQLFEHSACEEIQRWRATDPNSRAVERQFLSKSKDSTLAVILVTLTPLPRSGTGDYLVTVRHVDPEEVHELILRQNDELEQLVEDRTEALRRTNKELEMFSYSVSHDLRSPLRSVLGYSAALIEDYEDSLGSEGKDYLKRITASAQRMDGLITAILSVSRISRASLERSDLSISDLATSLIPEVSRQCPNAKIVVQPGMMANADPALLRVVVANLLDNACKFSSLSPEPVIEMGMADDLPGKRFFVRDNGVGFDSQYSEKIFEPFERLFTETTFPGTGIGLFNVRRVIERHQGKVWAEAEPGKGATFYFTLNGSG